MLVSLLLEKGAKVNRRSTPHSRTPIQRAAWSRNERITKLLLEKGADVDGLRKDLVGRTSLHLIAECDHGIIAEMILESKVADFGVSVRLG